MRGCLPCPAELGCTQTISGSRLRSPVLRFMSPKARHAVTCQVQTPSKSTGSGVAMRELPLPGSEAPQPKKGSKQAYESKSASQQASNNQAYRSTGTTQQDVARRNSNQQASTSSSPSSVSFEPRKDLNITKTHGPTRNGRQRLDANAYDVTTSLNQAAPGFTAASQSASAARDLRAESYIDAGQSE